MHKLYAANRFWPLFEIKLRLTDEYENTWIWRLKKYARLTELPPKITPKQLQMINQIDTLKLPKYADL